MPLVADTGDALFASVDIRSNECIAPAYYATMGFAVPAALGAQIASGRRPLVLVGDGAFQMTGSEISHARKYGCNPIVVLLNNSRWEMLQAFFPDARYNETVGWPFLEAGRAVGRPRIQGAHAAAVPRRARRGVRRGEALHADRGGLAARRHLADSSRVRARGEDAGACQVKRARGRGQRAQASCTCRPCCCSRRCRWCGHGRSCCTSATTSPGSAATITAFSGTCGGCGRR